MNFDKEAKFDKTNFGEGGGGGGGGGRPGTETKTVCQTVSNEVIQKCNYLHSVEHVVQSTFQNTLISF